MHKLIGLIGLVAAAAMPAIAGAQEPAETPTEAPAEAPAEAPTVVESAPVSDQPEAVRALQSLDVRRLETEPAYAATIVGHIEEIERLTGGVPGQFDLDSLHAYALVCAGRQREARVLLDRIIASRPDSLRPYGFAWFSALRLGDYDRALTLAELATSNLRSSDWQSLRQLFERRHIWMVLRHYRGDAGRAQRTRLAEALFRIGWPGRDDPQSTDGLRMIMIEDRIGHSDLPAAADLAAGLTSVSDMLSLIVLKRFDPAVGEQDRLALLARTIEEEDRATAAALADAPQDLRRVLARAKFLRGQARERDALAVLEPFTRDIPATVALAEEGMWVVNEAAYALIALGRPEEGAALTGALAAMPIAERPDLISSSINHAAVLWAVGRYADALAHATRLDREMSQYASDYGRMWMLASGVCALQGLGRGSEAAAWMRRLRSGRDANPAALTRAHLCLGELDAAEALVIRRLGGDDAEQLLVSLQDYRLGTDHAAASDPLYPQFAALRERPAVRAAVERVGRIMPVPLSRTYWGGN